MKPVVIYYRHQALVFCSCGVAIEYPLYDVLTKPAPAPGDVIVCSSCKQELLIETEEVL